MKHLPLIAAGLLALWITLLATRPLEARLTTRMCEPTFNPHKPMMVTT